MQINVLLFAGFETLDAFGPVELFGSVPGWRCDFYSTNGGAVISHQLVPVLTRPLSDMDPNGTLLLPGGLGTREMVKDHEFLRTLDGLAEYAQYVLCVCTGSALLAKSGALDGRRATSNKQAWAWASTTSTEVDWVYSARWVKDGKFYTSSGVSAGMDMALGFIEDIEGRGEAERVADYAEYIWNKDAAHDPFAR